MENLKNKVKKALKEIEKEKENKRLNGPQLNIKDYKYLEGKYFKWNKHFVIHINQVHKTPSRNDVINVECEIWYILENKSMGKYESKQFLIDVIESFKEITKEEFEDNRTKGEELNNLFWSLYRYKNKPLHRIDLTDFNQLINSLLKLENNNRPQDKNLIDEVNNFLISTQNQIVGGKMYYHYDYKNEICYLYIPKYNGMENSFVWDSYVLKKHTLEKKGLFRELITHSDVRIVDNIELENEILKIVNYL